jgi:hypothetical protein
MARRTVKTAAPAIEVANMPEKRRSTRLSQLADPPVADRNPPVHAAGEVAVESFAEVGER